jgi:hypothetical protein
MCNSLPDLSSNPVESVNFNKKCAMASTHQAICIGGERGLQRTENQIKIVHRIRKSIPSNKVCQLSKR